MDIEKGVGFPIYATDQFSGMFAKLKGEVTSVADQFGKLNAMLAVTGLAAGFAAARKAAEESEAATRRLEAVLRATGNASGYTAGQLGIMADNLARVTQFDDEAFRTATATILRFGDVSGKQLERTLKLSADLAAFMGTDLPGAAETLGKAIAAPTQGMDRLQRTVGYFTEAQKAAVKAMDEGGDRLGAQNALLDILQGKIGGTAEVMNQGMTRAVRDLTKAINELLEVAGRKGEDSLPVKALDTISSSLRAMKAVIEDGDWMQKLLLIAGYGLLRPGALQGAKGVLGAVAMVDAASSNRSVGAPDPGADFMVQNRALAAAEEQTTRHYDAALRKLMVERYFEEKKRLEEAAREKKKLLEQEQRDRFEAASAMLKADEMFAETYTEAWKWADHYRTKEMEEAAAERLKILEAESKGAEMFADVYVEAWKWVRHYQDLEAKKEAKYWEPFLSGIDDAFRNTWDAFVTKGANAGRVLRESLKRTFFDWLYQQFAKPFVLNIVASVGNSMGLSGLGSAATAAAGGSNALGGLGSILSAAGSFLGGPELLAGVPTFLEGLGPMLSAAGPYAAAIAAVYTLYTAFKDKGENWKGKLGFGSNATAYTTEGVFGREGFEYLAGNDTTNRAIQAFMGSTRGLDTRLASRLTPEQIAAITGRLSGPYGTRNDGQPAEFAFGKDDTTAAQQLTLEYLQKKYGTVFDTIDTTFAEFIRGYTGKSEDLLKSIIEFAGILDALDASGIKGLNITTLRAFKKEGEELGETFSRIAKQWATYQDLFYTDAEKIGMAQGQVNAVFAALGVEVPSSMEAFRQLVEGLDLTTEAGRAMFESLMTIAPAFASVSNAAKSLLSTFDQIVGSMRPGYSRGVLEQSLQSEVLRFMGGASWTQGLDWRFVASRLRLIERDDFLNYSSAQQQIITTILSIISQLDALDNSAGNAAGSVGTLGNTARTAAEAMADAKGGLWQYLTGLYTNSSLSPLDPMQQLGVAKNQFLEQLRLAQGGDVGAASGLSGYIDTVLGLGRTAFASGPQYVDLFNWITGLAGDFARPGGAQELQRLGYEEMQRHTVELAGIRELLARIADQGPRDTEYLAAVTEQGHEAVAQAVVYSKLATDRR